jgi:sigma-E factor negative regulatory protein RseA
MAEKTNEQLSALMDGECVMPERDLVLRRLTKDAELRVCWQRYHLISDALKNNVPDTLDFAFAERISKVIMADPPLPAEGLNGPMTWYKPVTGFALAASVALVTFVGFRLTLPTNAEPPPQMSSSTLPAPPADTAQLPTPDDALAAKLNNYLVSHNEYASMHSVHGVLPYVRMVGYQPNP